MICNGASNLCMPPGSFNVVADWCMQQWKNCRETMVILPVSVIISAMDYIPKIYVRLSSD